MKDVVIQILLYFGVAVCLLSALGILVMRGMYDKLHYLAPMSTVGALSISAAYWVEKGGEWASLKVGVILLILAFSSAVLTQATARAAEVREQRLHDQEGKGP